MTLLVDVDCPDCGRSRPIRKYGLGRYRCRQCGQHFSSADVVRR